MSVINVKTISIENLQILANNWREHSVVMDQDLESGGNNMGATPLELVIMGFAGCLSTFFTIIARKMHLNVAKIKIDTEAERLPQEKTISSVRYTMSVESEEQQEKLEKCLETAEKSCPVGVLFEKAGIKIEGKLEKK